LSNGERYPKEGFNKKKLFLLTFHKSYPRFSNTIKGRWRRFINREEIKLTTDSPQTEHASPIGEDVDSSNTVRKVLNCEQLGNTYCLELDDGTFVFMDFSCG
jgi:hypothetical protein